MKNAGKKEMFLEIGTILHLSVVLALISHRKILLDTMIRFSERRRRIVFVESRVYTPCIRVRAINFVTRRASRISSPRVRHGNPLHVPLVMRTMSSQFSRSQVDNV